MGLTAIRKWCSGWLDCHADAVRRVTRVIAGALALTAFIALLLGPVAWWVGGSAVMSLTGKARAEQLNGVREMLLVAIAGIGAAIGLFFTAQTYALSKAGQVTDRFSRAVEHLGSNVTAQQLGGVYALERLMRDSATDHQTLIEVLTAFIRDEAGHPAVWYPKASESARPPSAAAQAALTVLGRRPKMTKERQLDLARTSIAHAYLNQARFPGVNLSKADLRHVHLWDAHLEDARMGGALLQSAHMRNAHMRGAHLGGTHLEDADFSSADLAGADLKGAFYDEGTKLGGAILAGAKLGGAHGLTARHLRHAVISPATHLPAGLAWTEQRGVYEIPLARREPAAPELPAPAPG